LNIDMVGRNSKDTVAVIAASTPILREAGQRRPAHRELNIKPVGDLWPQEGLFFRSDHYNFAKKACPSSSSRPGYIRITTQVSDSPTRSTLRRKRASHGLLFHLGLAVAKHVSATALETDSYKRIVGRRN